jgi:Zn-dependent protease
MDPAAPPPGQPSTPPAGPAVPGAVRLGSAFGVSIYLRWSWLFLAVALVYLYGPVEQRRVPGLSSAGSYGLAFAFVAFLLLSVLLHELGHALTARGFGIGVKAITLDLLGGYTEMEGESPRPSADFFVSAVGPAVSFVIGAVAWVIQLGLPDRSVADELALLLAGSNILVAVFNALPGLPLDGGRALRAVIWGATGDRNTGTQVAGWIGRALAILIVVAGVLLAYSGVTSPISAIFAGLIAWTLWQGATIAIRQARMTARLPLVDLRRLARPVVLVMAGTPLSEAARRAAETGYQGAPVAIVDSSGRVVGLVHEQAANAVPVERRPWVPVESVARTLDPGRTLPVTLAGDEVIRAVQAHPAPSYLVVSGTDVVGVLRTADLARLLQA